ncbi:hypothetical protein [Aurantibacillus circumpalustris]|uniref:hypothetical protein n=1 Tax=Aurantibacillus circumpalustris TaxID=3036359 RepID=UPI00295AF852|nr:hypothetical protein [Aurantibacillus circumpalustris]
MKRWFIFSFGILPFLFSSFNISNKLICSAVKTCDQIPVLNQKLIDFVKTNLNKKVGRGECWDLAAHGLNAIGANWDKNYGFGKEIDLKKDCVFPGDLIQFEGVEIQYQKKNSFYREELEHHTAIIFKVHNKESFVLAEQNTTDLGKKVGTAPLELKNILKGTFKIYRPVN